MGKDRRREIISLLLIRLPRREMVCLHPSDLHARRRLEDDALHLTALSLTPVTWADGAFTGCPSQRPGVTACLQLHVISPTCGVTLEPKPQIGEIRNPLSMKMIISLGQRQIKTQSSQAGECENQELTCIVAILFYFRCSFPTQWNKEKPVERKDDARDGNGLRWDQLCLLVTKETETSAEMNNKLI